MAYLGDFVDAVKYDEDWRMEPTDDGRVLRIYYNSTQSDYLSFAFKRMARKSLPKTHAEDPARIAPQEGGADQKTPPWKNPANKVTLMQMYMEAETFYTGEVDSLILDFAASGAIYPIPAGPKVRAAYLLESEGFSQMHHLAGESIDQIKTLLSALTMDDGATLGRSSDEENTESFLGATPGDNDFDTLYISASKDAEYGQERYEYTGMAREVVYEWPEGFAITVAGHGSIMVVTYNGTPLDNLMLPISWHHDNYREMVPDIIRLYKRGTFVTTPYMSGVALDFTDAYVEHDDPHEDRDKRFRAAYVSKAPNARHVYATYASSLPELVSKLANFRW